MDRDTTGLPIPVRKRDTLTGAAVTVLHEDGDRAYVRFPTGHTTGWINLTRLAPIEESP